MSHYRPTQALKKGQKGFFATDNSENKGARSFVVLGFLATGAASGQIMAHTLFSSHYRDYVRLYKKGFSLPVPKPLEDRFKSTLNLLNIDPRYQKYYNPFMACGFDMISMGTSGKCGIHIGLPVNFTYNTVSDVDKSRIMVNQGSVVWDSEAGQQLLKSLVMPEQGQMYAMAREIKMRDSLKLYLDISYALVGAALAYFGGTSMNKRLHLQNQPRPVRLVGIGLVAAFSGLNYLMCKDFTQNYYEEVIDRELKELDPIFAEGGKQFYTQILERNKALRTLMGKEGESTYTVLGNENFLFRHKHRPLVQRKIFFEEPSEQQINQ
ncbi:unnamed protein product [Ceutorhynchus assimilis]|uniref:Transmembrane protein 177 n=1 Tax=Ceutorhynchus assimilis TaxID=467358 RepID=A0A9N9MBY6_9CUCU|nr:unnamed protein product [Ceutorhynchus assimilis]